MMVEGSGMFCLNPRKESVPSFDTRQVGGEFGGQPSWDESPAKKPPEPGINRIVLNCACWTALRPKLNTALPLPCCRARSAAVKVSGVNEAARLKVPTTVLMPLKIL